MNRLKALRISAQLTQSEVASRIGVSQVSVWQWEAGVTKPRADKLPAIAKLYMCSIDDLFDEEVNECAN